jgi:hypothetical protein
MSCWQPSVPLPPQAPPARNKDDLQHALLSSTACTATLMPQQHSHCLACQPSLLYVLADATRLCSKASCDLLTVCWACRSKHLPLLAPEPLLAPGTCPCTVRGPRAPPSGPVQQVVRVSCLHGTCVRGGHACAPLLAGSATGWSACLRPAQSASPA